MFDFICGVSTLPLGDRGSSEGETNVRIWGNGALLRSRKTFFDGERHATKIPRNFLHLNTGEAKSGEREDGGRRKGGKGWEVTGSSHISHGHLDSAPANRFLKSQSKFSRHLVDTSSPSHCHLIIALFDAIIPLTRQCNNRLMAGWCRFMAGNRREMVYTRLWDGHEMAVTGSWVGRNRAAVTEAIPFHSDHSANWILLISVFGENWFLYQIFSALESDIYFFINMMRKFGQKTVRRDFRSLQDASAKTATGWKTDENRMKIGRK